MYLFGSIRAQKAFLRDESGAIAPIFAVCISFLVLVMVLALEFGRWAVAQNELQANLDAAVLAGAEKLQSNRADTAGAVAAAKAVFDANKANQRFAGEITDTITFKVVGSSVISEGTASISSTLAKVAGVASFPLLSDTAQGAGRSASNARATISNNKFEIALMLDITGSMCDDPQPTNLTDAACKTGTKITALKNAAKGLVNTVLATTDLQSRVKVSIVPFSDGVRPPSALLTTLRGVTLLPLPYSYSENRQIKTIWYHPTDCVAERGGDNAYTDAAPGPLAPQNYFMTAMRQGTSLTNATPKEFGCMLGAASEVVPLSNNKDILNSKIDALEAKGGTAGHLGTAWAWYTLSPKWKDVWPGTDSDPAPYESPTNPEVHKIAVLMTDGDYNNQWSAGGYRVGAKAYTTAINGSSSDQAAALCTAMKKKDTVNTNNNVNIEIYTVGFLVSPAASTFLTACATDSSHAILTDTTNGLVAAFQGIAQRVVALYLSK